MQNATPEHAGSPRRGRGRPPAFDADVVVDRAMRAFWERGVGHTTLRDLEAATGADRSTLYNSFGGKDGLHRAAAAAYVAQVERALFAPLHEGTAGLADVVEFLDRLATQLASDDVPAGCLVVNDLADPGCDATASRRYLDALDAGLRAALGRAADAGALDPAAVDGLTRTVAAAVVGANLVARHAGPQAAVEALAGVRTVVHGARSPV